MKKVLLIGDSTLQGYRDYVKAALEGEAEVYSIPENSQFAAYAFRNLENWKNKLGLGLVDAVHWNVGLWDTLRMYGDFETVTPPEVYAHYIGRIERRIEFLFPGAKVAFATSTPVWEEMYNPKAALRFNRDIEKYNEIALSVLDNFPVTINDLYTLMKDCPKEWYKDCTHLWTPEGTKKLGDQVVAVVRDLLASSNIRKDTEDDATAIELGLKEAVDELTTVR